MPVFRFFGLFVSNPLLRSTLCIALGWLLYAHMTNTLNAMLEAQASLQSGGDFSYEDADTLRNGITCGVLFVAMLLRRHWSGECLLALLVGAAASTMGLLNITSPEEFRLGLYLTFLQQVMVMGFLALAIAQTGQRWQTPAAWYRARQTRKAFAYAKRPDVMARARRTSALPYRQLSKAELNDLGIDPRLILVSIAG